MLPADADIHLVSDPEGAFVSAEPIGFMTPLKERRADLAFVTFDKDLSNPKKKSLVAKYKKQMEQFIQSHGASDDAVALRRAFIKQHAQYRGLKAHGVTAR